jgi:DNA modification methylase
VSVRIITGDCLESLRQMEAESVQCCVTSPPYFGLRDYGHPGQLGLEKTPELYVAGMVEVFREVKRVLRNDGTLWLNIGDSYANTGNSDTSKVGGFTGSRIRAGKKGTMDSRPRAIPDGCKPKDLIGIPWMLAFALRADGWYLRSDIIWHKPNPMPESVTDRPTKSHEYLFLLSKSDRYFYDADAIAEESTDPESLRGWKPRNPQAFVGQRFSETRVGFSKIGEGKTYPTRNRRSVWTVTVHPYSGAHFATFPPALIEPCIKAGSAKGDTVLDPFGGAGTTGLVADRLGRNAILCELNPEYVKIAERRIHSDNPLFTETEVA